MRVVRSILTSWIGALSVGSGVILAQPSIPRLDDPLLPVQPERGGVVENLRVASQSPDRTEATLTLNYAYGGEAGEAVQLVAAVDQRQQRHVPGWFGCDPVRVTRGRGALSMRVRFFNDEPGVPPSLVTDQVRILLLNEAGTFVLETIRFAKEIEWGLPEAIPLAGTAVALKKDDPVIARSLEGGSAVTSLANNASSKAIPIATPHEAQNKATNTSPDVAHDASTYLDSRQRSESALDEVARRLDDLRQKLTAQKVMEERAREEAFAKMEFDLEQVAEQNRLARDAALAERVARDHADDLARGAQWELAAQLNPRGPGDKGVPGDRAEEGTAQGGPAQSETSRMVKIRITNVDVVNRSVDRTQMTVGVEFDYSDDLEDSALGVELSSRSNPASPLYFRSAPAEIKGPGKNFVLLPVRFQPPPSESGSPGLLTDQLSVYWVGKTSRRYQVLPTNLFLSWQPPVLEKVPEIGVK